MNRYLALFLSFVLMFVGLACAVLKPVARTVDQAAAMLLCEDVFAQQYGISVEDARKLYCNHRDVLQPFLAGVKSARSDATAPAFAAAQSEAAPPDPRPK